MKVISDKRKYHHQFSFNFTINVELFAARGRHKVCNVKEGLHEIIRVDI